MLNEKIAVITGASRGIGAAIAKKMAENGATVIINYQGSVQAAQALEAEIRERVVKQLHINAMFQILTSVKSLLEILLKNMEESIFL